MKSKYYCKNCYVEISERRAIRCRSCAMKKRFKINPPPKKENSPIWKGGKPKCLDCNKKVSDYKSKRCRKCSHNFYKDINHPRYIDGRTKNTRCIDCGKGIKINQKRCKSCENKRRYKNPKNHPFWQGGMCRFPYPFAFNNTLKESIRKRDNYTCQVCHKRGNTVHHIDYNKKNIKTTNLITTCRKHNSSANHNRDYWYAYFTYLMEKK